MKLAGVVVGADVVVLGSHGTGGVGEVGGDQMSVNRKNMGIKDEFKCYFVERITHNINIKITVLHQ